MGMNDYLEMLNRSGRPMTKNEIKIRDLQQQLQAYKDKEDKLRELVNNINDLYSLKLGTQTIQVGEHSIQTYIQTTREYIKSNIKNDILQILNEGTNNEK
jgi:2-oxoglutarate dehydrogenase complex dehydrogenase (E1) component-like enzyme